MRKLDLNMRRWFSAVLCLPALGCILTSGQVLTTFELGSFAVRNAGMERINVDLNELSNYAERKGNLKGLADLAVLGEITNHANDAIDIVAYVTPEVTSDTSRTQVTENAVLAWGPFHVDGGATVRVDWDTSAALFSAAGRSTLLRETKGDGTFTVYIFAAGDRYDFSVADGQLVVILDAGF